MAPTKREIKDAITECFKSLDVNNDGKISKEELKNLIRAVFGMPKTAEVPDKLAQGVMTAADKDKSGFISVDELQGAVHALAGLQVAFMLEALFRELDKDGNGFLSKSELLAMVKDHVKEQKDKEKLAKALGKLPEDTKISREDFIRHCFTMVA